MSLSKQYSQDQLNFFRVCHVTTDLIPEGLRKVFKQEWDGRYGSISSLGPWHNTVQNGKNFFNMTTPREKNVKKKELSIIKNGNTAEWDCTCLFYSILYSNCIGMNALDPTVQKSVDSLRKYRNAAFGHAKEGRIIESSYKTSMHDVINAFKDLKLDTSALEEIRDETSFNTAELNDVQQKWEEEKKKNEGPSCFCVLPSKPSHDTFQRDREVSNICQEIERLRSSNPGDTTKTYLSGNPGSGKSVLARQIGRHLYFDIDKDVAPRFVMTLDGSSFQSLIQSYSDLTRKLSCDEKAITAIITSKELSPEQRLFQLQGLAAPKIDNFSTWLLIIDDVHDLKSISKFIVKAGQPNGIGHILITTQDDRSILASQDTHHFSLSKGMEPDDAVQMLVSISKADKSEETLTVASELDYQPLALACAAVFMHCASRTDPSMDWKKCLQSIRYQIEVTERNYKDTSMTYTKTMTTAVRMAVEKEKENPTMMHAFQFLSVMAPDYVPLKVVVDFVHRCLPNESEHDLITDITGSSLVLSLTEDNIVTSIRMHQVVHTAIQMNSEQKTSTDFWLNVIDVFSYLKDIDITSSDFIAATRPLVVHFVSLSHYLSNVTINILSVFQFKKMENATNVLAVACSKHGKFDSSKMLLQVTLERTKNIYGEKSNHFANRLNDFGLVLKDLGEYENAKVHLEKALAISECNYDKNHPFISTALCNLGLALRALGEYGNAKVHLERALAIDECNYDKNHPSISTKLSNLGLVLADLGEYENAKVYLQRALAIQEHNYDKDHPFISTILNNLGLTLRALGEYGNAKVQLEKALAIDECNYDKNHPSISTKLNNLGLVLLNLCEYKNAKVHMERALAIAEYNYDINHPSISTKLSNLAIILRYMGEYENEKVHLERAKVHLERALAIDECNYDKNHPSISTRLSNLGLVLRALREYENAKVHLERALAIDECNYHKNHPSISPTLTNLGLVLRDLGEYDNAKMHLERALAIEECTYDKNHPSISTKLSNLGLVLQDLGENENAEMHFKRANAIDEFNYDKNFRKVRA